MVLERRRSAEADDLLRKVTDRCLDRVAEVDRARQSIRAVHQADQPHDQVVDIAEGAGLRAIAIARAVHRILLSALTRCAEKAAHCGDPATILIAGRAHDGSW
jgi:hypothetical protein